MEFLSKLVPIAMLAFVVSSMLAVGLSLTIGQIVAPLRNIKLVSLALLANFVLMPLAALAIASALNLDEPLGIALILLGTAAGAPFLPKLAGLARGNLAFAVGLMVLLMVLTPCRGTSEERAEPVQAPLGRQALPTDPVGGRRQRLGCQLVRAHPTDLGRGDDPGRLEHTEVLHHGWQCHLEGASQLGHRGGSSGQALEHCPSAGVRQGVEHPVERPVVILRRVPKY